MGVNESSGHLGGFLRFLSLLLLLTEAPFVDGPHGLADEGTMGPATLTAAMNRVKQAGDGGSELALAQDNVFKPTVNDMGAVFEIGLKVWRVGSGAGERGAPVRIEGDVGASGEGPVQGNEKEVGKDFLFDASFGPGVKVLDIEDALADLVQFLDAPSAMVDTDEFLERIALPVQQRGSETEYAPRNFVFEQS